MTTFARVSDSTVKNFRAICKKRMPKGSFLPFKKWREAEIKPVNEVYLNGSDTEKRTIIGICRDAKRGIVTFVDNFKCEFNVREFTEDFISDIDIWMCNYNNGAFVITNDGALKDI